MANASQTAHISIHCVVMDHPATTNGLGKVPAVAAQVRPCLQANQSAARRRSNLRSSIALDTDAFSSAAGGLGIVRRCPRRHAHHPGVGFRPWAGSRLHHGHNDPHRVPGHIIRSGHRGGQPHGATLVRRLQTLLEIMSGGALGHFWPLSCVRLRCKFYSQYNSLHEFLMLQVRPFSASV